MQAIHVKYLPGTEFRPSRYKASAQAGSVTLEFDHALGFEAAAAKAAVALCTKLGWTKPFHGDLICGGLPDGSYVFVFAEATHYPTIPAPVFVRIGAAS